MFLNQGDFTGDVLLKDFDEIEGAMRIVDDVERKHLKLLLGSNQYQTLIESYFNKSHEEYAKWQKFINGGSYLYDGDLIDYRGARSYLRYFAYFFILKETRYFTAGNDIWQQVQTGTEKLSEYQRKNYLKDKYNAGVNEYMKSYWFIWNNDDYTFDTAYMNELKFKTILEIL